MTYGAFLVAFLLAQPPIDVQDAHLPVGPAVLCFQRSSFTLAEGERVVDDQGGGLHGVRLEIAGPRGRYRVLENEIMRMPTALGRRVHSDSHGTVYRSPRRPISYAFVARTDFSPSRNRMIAVLSGEALTGRSEDRHIYRRLTLGDPSVKTCDHRYAYGWSALTGAGD